MKGEEAICYRCNGFGYNPNDRTEKICPVCKGSGITIKKERPIVAETPVIDEIDAFILKAQQKRKVIK